MSCAVLSDCHSKCVEVAIRPFDGVCAVTLESKDAAVSLRQQLVRRGIRCTFPMPTWEHSKFEFHAKHPPGMSYPQLEELIHSLTAEQMNYRAAIAL